MVRAVYLLAVAYTLFTLLTPCSAKEPLEWAGKRVMVKNQQARFSDGSAVFGATTGGLVLTVERAEGDWLTTARGMIRVQDAVVFEDAFDHFSGELKRRPTSFAYINRSRVSFDRGDYEAGIADCDQVIQLDHEYAPAYGNRGWACSKLGQHDKAIADLSTAIRLDPKHAANHLMRGRARLMVEDYEGAIADCNEALRLDPASAGAYRLRGEARLRNKDYVKAAADLEKAAELDPAFALPMA